MSDTESDNKLKVTALSAAVSSGFLSGFTSAVNIVTMQFLRRKLTQKEIEEYSQRAMAGADTWYVPTFLKSGEGQAIAEILGVELPSEKSEGLPGKEIEVETKEPKT